MTVQLITKSPQTKQNPYPPKVVDSLYGQIVEFDLFTTDNVLSYTLQFAEGTLSGGTSPEGSISAAKPAVAHIKIEADNTTLLDMDAQIIQLENEMFRNALPNGLSWIIDAADIEVTSKAPIVNTSWPTYLFSQLKMYITLPSLSALTTGGPTGSTGSTLYLVEDVIPRFAVKFRSVQTRKVQANLQALSITGDNDEYNALPKTGLYKFVGIFASTTAPANGVPAYSAGSDSAISKVEIELNNVYSPVKTFWSALKQADAVKLHQALPAGYAVLLFMDGIDINKMLNLSNPNEIKEADLKLTATTVPVYVTVFYTLYR